VVGVGDDASAKQDESANADGEEIEVRHDAPPLAGSIDRRRFRSNTRGRSQLRIAADARRTVVPLRA